LSNFNSSLGAKVSNGWEISETYTSKRGEADGIENIQMARTFTCISSRLVVAAKQVGC